MSRCTTTRPSPLPWLAAACLASTVPLSAAAQAQAATSPAAPSLAGEFLAILVPLVVIIGALLLVLRMARRRYGLVGAEAPLTVVQVLAVGPRERVVVLRTRAGKAFAIGVGAQSINLIAPLDAADIAVPEPADDAASARPASTNSLLGLLRR